MNRKQRRRLKIDSTQERALEKVSQEAIARERETLRNDVLTEAVAIMFHLSVKALRNVYNVTDEDISMFVDALSEEFNKSQNNVLYISNVIKEHKAMGLEFNVE